MTLRNGLKAMVVSLVAFVAISTVYANERVPVRMAVEFMDHAAAAFICHDKGWFGAAGLDVKSYETYVSGMALASALARGDIDAAFICLVPAINAYSNAKVPIKIVAGTHKHGYGLVVRKNIIASVEDLQTPGVRLGCVREGGAVDVLLQKAIDVYLLDKEKVLPRIQRMSPARQVLALRIKQLDAAILPEQWATMAETDDCRMLFTSHDVWPDMQGSVLAVKQALIQEHPGAVRKLISVLQRATDWINGNPTKASVVVARQLKQVKGGKIQEMGSRYATAITPNVLARSMARLNYTTDIDPSGVQETIDYMAGLGYIKKAFKAEDLLALQFLEESRGR